MGFVCCIPGCKNKSNSGEDGNGIQLHRFPNNQQLFDRWLTAIGRSDFDQKTPERIRACYRVCSVHFGSDTDQIGGRRHSRIRSDSVPTLFLGNSIESDATPAESQNEHQGPNPRGAVKKPLGEQQNGNNSDSISNKRSVAPLRGKGIRVVHAPSQIISSALDIQTKRIVFNIYSNLKRENDDFSENQILERICELTKITPDLVCEAISERCNRTQK